jgi:CopG family nickel-responsive transcriptional regulator
MTKLVRFSVSMEEKLVAAFDRRTRKRGYATRSEAIRDALRAQLVRQEWEEGEEVAGVITLLYKHSHPGLSECLTEIQHHALLQVISTTHIHLDRENCLEFVAVRGKAERVRKLADGLISLKGVKHGELAATSVGKRLL